MIRSALAVAERALRDEAELLRAGRYEDLALGADARRTALEAGLEEARRRGPEAQADLERLKAAGMRNAALMRAVLDGFAEARALVETGAAARRTIGYGPDGAALGAPAGPSRDLRG
ncbi:MAG: hypothetical protein AAGI51_15285 [Pseudomonadota bacterium]